MKNLIKILFFFIGAVSFSSCFQSKFEKPEFPEIPTGQAITITDIYGIYNDSVVLNNNVPYKFDKDISVFAIVVMDDKSGNIYKSAYIQDADAGINLRLISSGGLYEGDSIRLNLKNTILSSYHGLLQIDSVNVDKNITKIATGKHIKPFDVEIGTITEGLLCKLIRVNNVQFVENEIGMVFANPNVTEDRHVENCDGNTLIVRNSGYANFASELIPNKKGSIIGIIAKYNTSYQLYIRHFEEVKLNKNRCGEYDIILSENFNGFNNNDIINIPNWLNISNNSTRQWICSVIDNGTIHTACVKNNGTTDTTWLVLPQQNITTNAAMQFSTKFQNNGGAKLELVYSTDFNGSGNPKDFNWITIPAAFATNLTVTGSGELNLPQENIYLAFRYSNSSANNSMFFLYNIMIYNLE